jgi:hypothetical protein
MDATTNLLEYWSELAARATPVGTEGVKRREER